MTVHAPYKSLIVRQCRHALFRSVIAERTTVVLVRVGTKTIRYGDKTATVLPGMICVLPARLSLSIENRPPTFEPYLAEALVFDDTLLEGMVIKRTGGKQSFEVLEDDRIRAAFERATTVVDDTLTPAALRDHALREVILWLVEAGVDLGCTRPLSIADRLRTLFSADPQESWTAPQTARALALSEATLRRRLAAERTSFSDLLADVRMTHALGLLQTTDQPINAVALAVGYASPSRFAARFQARFGLAPSAIRGTEPRIVTPLD